MILMDQGEILTLVGKCLSNNLCIKKQMITDLKIFVNFNIWSVVAICKIGRDFDWLKCKKEKSYIWWWKKICLWHTHFANFCIRSVTVNFYTDFGVLVVVKIL